VFLIYSPDGTNPYGSRGGQFDGIGLVEGLKVVKFCSWGRFLFTRSDTFVAGRLATMHSVTDRQTDRQTDRGTNDSIMPIADHTAFSTIG